MKPSVLVLTVVMAGVPFMSACTTHTHERDNPPAVIHQDIKESSTSAHEAAREGAREGVRDTLR